MRRCASFVMILALLAILHPVQAGARWIDLGGESVAVDLLETDGSRSVIEISVGGFEAEKVLIEGRTYFQISLEDEGMQRVAGMPELPNVRRSIVIPDDRRMRVSVLESQHVDLHAMPVAPSKGHLLRSVDPASVRHSFDAFYQGAGVWPERVVVGEEPYIMRDVRGMVLDANVFQYHPDTEVLRVYTRLRIEITAIGPGEVNVLQRSSAPAKIDRQFAKLYENHFLNWGVTDRYEPVLEDGGLLIITYDSFYSSMVPFYEWKLQKGIDTRLVNLSEVGGTATQIANYIADDYNSRDIAYVLLVGDDGQMPKPSGGADPMYSLIVGSDNYPDVFVGRFSAENAAQVATQVDRTVTYERDIGAGESWSQYGMGVASNQGPGHYGEYDDEHEDLIRQDLLAYGYMAVDQIYDPSGTAAMVASGLNAGRGIVNYTGHGSSTSWGSTGFSNSHVNALVNDDMLPFIVSVACNNGTYTGGTCFAEAWQRATNGGEPTGAIASYMSYISQSWDPPMYAQDEAVDLLIADAMRTIGGLWYNGSCHMMDLAGAQGVTEFKNWMIFGDPSICVRTKAPVLMAVGHAGALFIGMTEYEVSVPGVEGALCALYADGTLYGSASTNGAGVATIAMANPPSAPMTLTLTVTAYNKVTAVEDVEVLPPSGPYLIFETCAVLDPDGDDDGMIDEGELVGIEVTLENVGIDPTSGVTAVLSSEDPYVSIVEGERSFPNIPAGGYGTCLEPFVVQVLGTIPDEHLVLFEIQASSNEGDWDAGFSLLGEAPVLMADGLIINDGAGGDGDGNANAGETVLLQLRLANVGHSDAEDLSGLLSCWEPYAVVIDGAGDCLNVPVGGSQIMSTFSVELDPLCPEPAHIDLQLTASAPSGYAANMTFDLPVGGWFDDMEEDRGWTVGAPGDNASAGHWVCVDPIGTEYNGNTVQTEDDHTSDPATLCFITGQHSPGESAGYNDVDGGKTTLLSPVFHLEGATAATISYWRWYTNDLGINAGDDYWAVDVTDDGVTWTHLEYTQVSAEEWLYFEFDLTAHVAMTDLVQIRFVATDEGLNSLVEAAVDDFLLDAIIPIATVVDDTVELPRDLVLGGNFPNPFNPTTTISFALPAASEVELSIFDVTGREVVVLVDGMMTAGHHEIIWNGRDAQGARAASGIYFSRLSDGADSRTGKMVLLK